MLPLVLCVAQLMDMGFSREHAMEALLNTTTMEQATEYLLTHPPPLLSGAVRVSFISKAVCTRSRSLTHAYAQVSHFLPSSPYK